ncbi:MAG: hypothetical protein QOF76_1817, partial [Solirubrobacteraceae bacterium]|nr:hypothetical protein [Solirubrobacteraceae bacterium]
RAQPSGTVPGVMSLTDLPHDATLPGSPPVAVVIPLFGAHDLFQRCLASVLAHTPADVPVLIADDAGPDPASHALAADLAVDGTPPLFWLRQPENLGFVGNCNAAFAATARADVIVLNSDCEVAEGWLEGLRDAAQSDPLIASASALSNHGSILSVPVRNLESVGLPPEMDLDRAAAALRARSPRLRPRIPTAIGHCMYLRRPALDLVGDFDLAFAPAYGEEVDWSQRAVLGGFVHVCADDVLVAHYGRGSFGVEGRRNPIQDAHEELLENRYPYYTTAVKDAYENLWSPLARAISLGRRELLGLEVTIDARSLGPVVTGTQVHVLELIQALARRDDIRVRVVLPGEVGHYASDALAALPQVERLGIESVHEIAPRRTDVVHRPFQMSDDDDIALMRRLGERLVVTHQDLIAFRNPGYHQSARDWQSYRRLTRFGLAAADAVIFECEHAKADARADDLVAEDQCAVIGIGVDHQLSPPGEDRAPQRPPGAEALEDGAPFLLCLGTNFRHKNRVWALRLLEQLLEAHGWPGRLVLAGPRIRYGSSAGDETAFLARRPALRERVVDLPAVSDVGKRWLYERATASLYPSLYEGFGLVPFEAADHGLPCIWAPVTAMAETLAGIDAPIVPWDVVQTAERILPLLTDTAAAAEQVAAVKANAARFTWDAHAESLRAVYEDVMTRPQREASPVAVDAIATEQERKGLERMYWDLHHSVGPLAMALVGPDGRLDQRSQRALAALSKRPGAARSLRAALGLVHRVGNVVTPENDD